MFPFPAIKNVFVNRGFIQRGHGYRIYLLAGETSAQNSAGRSFETFYGAAKGGSRSLWRHGTSRLRTWVGPWGSPRESSNHKVDGVRVIYWDSIDILCCFRGNDTMVNQIKSSLWTEGKAFTKVFITLKYLSTWIRCVGTGFPFQNFQRD